jgi:DNA-binding FadR family transcriptional regulator
MEASAGRVAVNKLSPVIESGLPTRPGLVILKAAQALAQTLKADIISRRVLPGQALPPPQQLERQYQVSRPTVREALGVLESQGLVRLKRGPKGGAIVQRPDYRSITHALADLLEYERVTPSQVFEIRAILEPAAARLAASRITPDELSALRECVSEMEARAEDNSAWLGAGILFHTLVFRASHNPVLHAFMDSLSHVMYPRAVTEGTPHELRPEALEEHRALLTSLASHHPDRAERAMAQHIRRMVARRGAEAALDGIAPASRLA